jgi:hypothetical protein
MEGNGRNSNYIYIINYVANVYVTYPASFPIGAQVTGMSIATSSYRMPVIRGHTFPIHSGNSVLIRGPKYVRVSILNDPCVRLTKCVCGLIRWD